MPILSEDPEALSIAKSRLGFPVVGIGASAGGVPALQRLFARMPAGTGMAFVVVTHLSPDHDSALGTILQRESSMPVITVTASRPIQADHIYVISPSMKLLMTDGELRVSSLVTAQGRPRSIDLFFRSLAQAHMERSVGIVLSGTGADGAQGLRRVKELGGVAIAQSPEDAEFDGMPKAAIETGAIDFVLQAGDMPVKLIQLWDNAKRIALPEPPADLVVETEGDETRRQAEDALRSVKALLRERTGHDFARYKRATVLRRLERRMQVNALPDLPSYRRLLDNDPGETQALLQDMLISVTNFFRDPEAFDALGSALRQRIEQRPAGEPLRVWVAGCATGEEAYSVAMLLRELLAARATPIQIFASDIDARAVASARVGVFPASIATDVAPERLNAHFTIEASGSYRIAKAIRDRVVFSAHNVLSDPPFTRMDLICCRNLLIYLDRSARAQLLGSFRFALKPAGLLFLGGAEAVDAASNLFAPEDKRHRLYAPSDKPKRSLSLPASPVVSMSIPALPMTPPPAASTFRTARETLHQRAVLRHAPPTVLVDADDTALHVDERASHLLRLPGGAPTNRLLELVRPELRAELRAALACSAQHHCSVEARRVRLVVNGKPRYISMSVRPVPDETVPGLFLVAFDESERSMVASDDEPAAHDPVVDALESQLVKAQSALRDTRGESAASTEELRASNEELQTINEELRSTSEELETSREELQAVNEELTSVNAELHAMIDETTNANDDLQNLMVSAEIGAVFLDREMRIKRFTPQAATLFNLLPTDTGRPLLDITHRLDYAQLSADAARVLRDLRSIEREVRSLDGRWFVARVLPYRTGQDHIDGTIFAFVDVSARKVAEEELRLSEQRMRLVADSMRDYAILTTDEQGTIATWSPGAERVFGYPKDEAVGQSFALIFTPEDRIADTPGRELRQAREHGRAADDRWHLRKDGERIYCSGITTTLIEGNLVGYAKIARDFTAAELQERERAASMVRQQVRQAKLEEASVMKDEFLAVVSHELKNPLAVIQMSAHLIARLPAFGDEPRAVRATDAIRSAVTSQAQIINDLLEFSRVNTGKVILERAPLDLPALVRAIAEAVGDDLAHKAQDLESELADGVSVLADSVRVEQIVWNLLTNAIKFTPDGGTIRLGLAVEGRMARLTVADSGIGIEPALLDEVFEMFRQVETGPSRRKSGLGIGLALVRQLAELHGGRAEATSEGLGRGAQFHVWLPLASQDAGDAVASGVVALPRLDALRILLVDDEPMLLAAFTDLLELEGATVVAAGSALEAVSLARASRFDAVVSDIAMPERDGYWLARELRRSGPTCALPIIAVSGMARDADQRLARDSGFDAHLGKPLDLVALGLAIEQAIGRRAVAVR